MGGGRVWTAEPGVREGWHQGRRWYHVWALLLEDPLVFERVRRVQEALTLAPSAPGRPHVTVWVRGFEAGFSHPREGERVEITLGGANSFLSCPFLEVRSPELYRLRAGFTGTEERWAPYLPHLTLGRYLHPSSTRELAGRLHPFRGMKPLRSGGTLRHCVVDAFSEEGRLELWDELPLWERESPSTG